MDALTSAICVLMTWTVLYMFFDMPPNSELASVVLLVSCSWACGKIAGMFYLPPLLGMLLAGVVLRNTGHYDVNNNNFQPHIINLRFGLPAGCGVFFFNTYSHLMYQLLIFKDRNISNYSKISLLLYQFSKKMINLLIRITYLSLKV